MNAKKVTTSEIIAVGTAHSKLILVGEHAVVHGQPAIAIPFPLIGVESTVEYVPGDVKIDRTFYHGPIDSAPKDLEGIVTCIKDTLKLLVIPCKNLLIRIQSTITPGNDLVSIASYSSDFFISLYCYESVDYYSKLLH